MDVAAAALQWGLLVMLGLGFQLAERVRPLRAHQPKRELIVDLSMLVFGPVFILGSVLLINAAFGALPQSFARFVEGVQAAIGGVPEPVTFVVALLLFDFAGYWVHRLQHSKALWHVHAFHHSPRHLYWLAGLRSSFVHVLLLQLGYAVALMWLPVSPIIGLVIGVLGILNALFIHSNVRASLGPLGWFLVTPRSHFVHHSEDPRFGNTNYGFIFTIWDRMFGTYTDPSVLGADYALGLPYAVSTTRLWLGVPPRAAG